MTSIDVLIPSRQRASLLARSMASDAVGSAAMNSLGAISSGLTYASVYVSTNNAQIFERNTV